MMNPMKDETQVSNKRVRRDRTEEILTEATKLFGKYGFRGTTLALVAEAVGLTEAGVLHYFPSKVHLLQGVLQYRDQKYIQRYSQRIEAEKTNVSEFFQQLEDFYADYVENENTLGLNQLFIVLVGESIRIDNPSHDFFVDRYRRSREVYTKQFLTQIQSKFRSDVDFDNLASLIIAVMDGLQIQWRLDPENVDLAATFNLFSTMVVSYLEE